VRPKAKTEIQQASVSAAGAADKVLDAAVTKQQYLLGSDFTVADLNVAAVIIAAGSISPQKLYGVPVGLMFFEGAHRLVKAGVTSPGMQIGDPERVVVEAYPGIVARSLIGRTSYKSDLKKRQTNDQLAARRHILNEIAGGLLGRSVGLR
jgi:hypothetical protein